VLNKERLKIRKNGPDITLISGRGILLRPWAYYAKALVQAGTERLVAADPLMMSRAF